MKKIISLLLVLASVLCFAAMGFAADEVVPFAVAEYSGGIVSSYSAAGTLIIQKDGEMYVLSNQYDYPTGLASDADGNLYVSETGANRIVKVDKTGKGTVYVKDLREPMGLCYAGGKLYVAETGANRILCVTAANKYEVVAGKLIETEDGDYAGGYVEGPVAEAQFGHPRGVAVTDEGVIYVADTDNHAIRMIKDGRVYSAWVNRDLSEELSMPGDIQIVDGKLEIYDMFLEKTLYMDLAAESFTDVKADDWFNEFVNKGVLYKIVKGIGDNKFAPNANVSRAQLACMIANIQLYLDGTSVIGGTNAFDDVKSGTWYTDAVCWASDNKIVQGYDGKFNPSDDITRQDLVTMLYRYAKYAGYDVTVNEAAYKTANGKEILADFPDTDQIADYALDAVKWAVYNKLLTGADGKILPKGTADRAQALTLIVKFIEK